MKKFIRWLIPPEQWKTAVAVLSGIFFGLALYAIYISKAPSYLTDNPETCVNCHVMNPQFASWAHSAHRRTATCNDCHVPNDNFLTKYLFKAQDGLRHATIFTLRKEPQVILIREAGRQAVQKNCIRCHQHTTGMAFLLPVLPRYHNRLNDRSCLDCHRDSPHGRVNGLSSAPAALVKTQINNRTEREEEEVK